MSNANSHLEVFSSQEMMGGKRRTIADDYYRLLVERSIDYAIFLLDPTGYIMTWNAGAERIKGYKPDEIIGEHFSRFYSRESRESGWPMRELDIAAKEGQFGDEGWRIRKDGSTFWASVVITALRNEQDELIGFSKVTRDLTERRALEERTQDLNRELRSQMTQLTESRSLLQLRTLELQRLSGQLMRVQDDERRRIARDLHDDLGQLLAALKMNLEIVAQGSHSSSLSPLVALTESAVQKVRSLSYVLHPPLLDESGLLSALHWYVDGFGKRSNLRISFDYKPSSFPRLAKDIEVAVFRIVQEAVTNVYRHSGSPDVRIELNQQPEQVTIRIRDFGKGIPGQEVGAPLTITPGVGISGMRERVKQFNGELRVTRADPGTLLEAIIPLFN